jgi:hypothetical protein
MPLQNVVDEVHRADVRGWAVAGIVIGGVLQALAVPAEQIPHQIVPAFLVPREQLIDLAPGAQRWLRFFAQGAK